jgi:uncharacterized protein (TIGR03083 family)
MTIATATTMTSTAMRRLARDDMTAMATVEYARMLSLLRSLDAADWSRPTACDEWDVRAVVAHLVGTVESSTFREQMRVARAGSKVAKRRGKPQVDGINEIQVRERDGVPPATLLAQLEAGAPAFIRFRARVPALLRRVKMPTPLSRKLSVGELVDVIYTRDVWIHRADICTATHREMELTRDHDGRMVEDLVAEWAGAHQQPFRLELDGPAGGSFAVGDGGASMRLDAIEFCRLVSGRTHGDGLLATQVLF